MFKQPIFIGGMYKSGTSLLRAMLGKHPSLFSGFETGWCLREGPQALELRLKLISELFDQPLSLIKTIYNESYCPEKFLDTLMSHLANSSEKKRWIEKTPLNIANISSIRSYWADAFILHIVRDPRDVYASLVRSDKWTSPKLFSGRWCSTCGIGLRHDINHRESSDYLFQLKYEDLVFSPAETLHKICDFTGLNWRPSIAVYEGSSYEADKLREILGQPSSTAESMRKPLHNGKIGIYSNLEDKHKHNYNSAVNLIGDAGFGSEFRRICSLYGRSST